METLEIKNNRLGTLIRFSLPCIISMLLQSVITITDGLFVGNYVGDGAMAAINLGLPVLYTYLALGLCVGVGGSVLAGHAIGEGKKDYASSVFSQTMVTSLSLTLLISLVFGFVFSPMLRVLGAEGDVSAFFTSYYRIMLFAYPLMVSSTILGMFIRTDGNPRFPMTVAIIGVIVNGVLDYIFMGVFDMGVKGSAVATLSVQALTVILEAQYFLKRSHIFRFVSFSFERRVFFSTMLNGSSEALGEISSALSMSLYNYVVMKYVGVEGVAAFSILGFAVYLYSMVSIGLGQGLVVPVSILSGGGEKKEAMEMRRLANRILIIFGVLFASLFAIFGKGYSSLFGSSDEVTRMVGRGFIIFSVTFPLMGYDVIGSMYFTAIKRAKESAIISSLRGMIVLLPLIIILPSILGMDGVWMVSPVTEMATAAVTTILLLRENRAMEKGL